MPSTFCDESLQQAECKRLFTHQGAWGDCILPRSSISTVEERQVDLAQARRVGDSVMGFGTGEIPTFVWTDKAGMSPRRLYEIGARDDEASSVRRRFVMPEL